MQKDCKNLQFTPISINSTIFQLNDICITYSQRLKWGCLDFFLLGNQYSSMDSVLLVRSSTWKRLHSALCHVNACRPIDSSCWLRFYQKYIEYTCGSSVTLHFGSLVKWSVWRNTNKLESCRQWAVHDSIKVIVQCIKEVCKHFKSY